MSEENKLKHPREVVEVELQKCIAEGLELKVSYPMFVEKFKSAKLQFNIWTEYNCELLFRMFTLDIEAKHYHQNSSCVSGFGPLSLEQEIDYYNAIVDRQIAKLQSVIKRLPLIEEVGTGKKLYVDNFWSLIHPVIIEVSKPRFDSSQFADSVEAALKEVNQRVKDTCRSKLNGDYDGAKMMKKVFSVNDPIIKLEDDLTDLTGSAIQQGYMELFAGAMTGVRNPKAHANVVITPERAIHHLFLASLLMNKLDDSKQIPGNP